MSKSCVGISGLCSSSPPQSKLCLSIPIQPAQKHAISHSCRIVLRVVNLRQPRLPRRIPLQQHTVAKTDDQVRLAHDGLGNLSVDELGADVGRSKLVVLRHLREGFGKVDEGLPAVRGIKK